MKQKIALLRGFTLIELLIVVAIIAILAAIAVPNFLEAQTRAKISRVKADMRSLATGLESYRVDNNAYVVGNTFGVAGANNGSQIQVLERLSTPIAYITTAFFSDPFKAKKRSGSIFGGTPSAVTAAQTNLDTWTDALASPTVPADFHLYRTYLYISTGKAKGSQASNASGIMRIANTDSTVFNPDGYLINSASPMEAYLNAGGIVAGWKYADCLPFVYDPTNGTVSFGNIWRTGGSPSSRDNLIGAADKSHQ